MKTLILDSAVKSIVAKLGASATTQPTFTAHWIDSLADNVAEGSTAGVFNSTTNVTVVAAPGTGRRIVKEITIHNGDNVDHNIEIYYDNDGTQTLVWSSTVAAGQPHSLMSDLQKGDPGDPGTQLAGINAQTGTAYTLVEADAGKRVRCNNANAITVTVPQNSSVAYDIGTVIEVEQQGAGVVTIDDDTNVALNGAVKTWGQYSAVRLLKLDTNLWTIDGGSE